MDKKQSEKKKQSVEQWLDEQDLARLEMQRIMDDLYPESTSGFKPYQNEDEDEDVIDG